MKKKYDIEVRIKRSNGTPRPFTSIKRVLYTEQIGNFCPVFCTFLGKKRLVKSDEGDLSDPFRRKDSYANTLYIEIEEMGYYLKTRDPRYENRPAEAI